MSRTVNGAPFFGDREKEILRKMIAQVAGFSGVEVLTYCIMKNHFHVLVRVPHLESLSDVELMRRFRILYPQPTDFQLASAADLERLLAENGADAVALRKRLMARMGNVSEFMKTLKQRFSVWFNKSRDRFGPVWSDRYKSVLVEGKGFALQTMAAYIDLNPVRAGIVDDPKDYRFCGYAEAVAGNPTAIEGVQTVISEIQRLAPSDAMQSYRQLLFGKGGTARSDSSGIDRTDALRVLEKEQGRLSTPVLLRCRVRYFTEGAVLGSREFVQSHADAWQQARRRKHPSKIRDVAANDDRLACLNACRGKVFS